MSKKMYSINFDQKCIFFKRMFIIFQKTYQNCRTQGIKFARKGIKMVTNALILLNVYRNVSKNIIFFKTIEKNVINSSASEF